MPLSGGLTSLNPNRARNASVCRYIGLRAGLMEIDRLMDRLQSVTAERDAAEKVW